LKAERFNTEGTEEGAETTEENLEESTAESAEIKIKGGPSSRSSSDRDAEGAKGGRYEGKSNTTTKTRSKARN